MENQIRIIRKASRKYKLNLSVLDIMYINLAVFDMQTVEALKAFQRHWRPVKVNGMLDVSTKQILTEVHKKLSEFRRWSLVYVDNW